MSMAVLFFASLSGSMAGFAAWAYTDRVQSHWPWLIAAAVLWITAAGFAIEGFKS